MPNIITTLASDGEDYMGPDTVVFHHPGDSIINGSILTVESNHYCVLKSRGAILDVYETGQYSISTPQRALVGAIQQAFYSGGNRWQYEALYVNRAKLVVKTEGEALSKEMARLQYKVDYYIHVTSPEDASTLVQHVPYIGHKLTTAALNEYAQPVIAQSINQVLQVTPFEEVNEKIHDLTEQVHSHLEEFLKAYGVTLDTLRVLIFPADERMRELIALRAFGLSELDVVRYYTAILMAEKGVISAPNMAVGEPFSIGQGVLASLPPLTASGA